MEPSHRSYLSIDPSIHPPIHLSIWSSVWSSVYPSTVHLSIDAGGGVEPRVEQRDGDAGLPLVERVHRPAQDGGANARRATRGDPRPRAGRRLVAAQNWVITPPSVKEQQFKLAAAPTSLTYGLHAARLGSSSAGTTQLDLTQLGLTQLGSSLGIMQVSLPWTYPLGGRRCGGAGGGGGPPGSVAGGSG